MEKETKYEREKLKLTTERPQNLDNAGKKTERPPVVEDNTRKKLEKNTERPTQMEDPSKARTLINGQNGNNITELEEIKTIVTNKLKELKSKYTADHTEIEQLVASRLSSIRQQTEQEITNTKTPIPSEERSDIAHEEKTQTNMEEKQITPTPTHVHSQDQSPPEAAKAQEENNVNSIVNSQVHVCSQGLPSAVVNAQADSKISSHVNSHVNSQDLLSAIINTQADSLVNSQVQIHSRQPPAVAVNTQEDSQVNGKAQVHVHEPPATAVDTQADSQNSQKKTTQASTNNPHTSSTKQDTIRIIGKKKQKFISSRGGPRGNKRRSIPIHESAQRSWNQSNTKGCKMPTTQNTTDQKEKQTSPNTANEIKGQHARWARRGKHRKQTNQTTNSATSFKLAYTNVQGKVGARKTQTWRDISDLSEENKWNAIAFTETHRKKGGKAMSLRGYQVFEKRRSPEAKKGGGIALFVKENVQCYEWVNDRSESEADSELLWVVIKGTHTDIALGIVYVGVQTTKNKKWNDDLYEALQQDITALKTTGKKVLIHGDFNGHIKNEGDDINDWSGDTNGTRLLQLARTEDLEIVNFSPKCTGKWTWMRGTKKSQIDFVLADNKMTPHISQVIIDEDSEKWDIGADHSWMETTLKLEGWRTSPVSYKTKSWRINDNTNWDSFQKEINPKLDKWETKLQDRDGTNLPQSYRELIKCIIDTGTTCVGLSDPTQIKKKCSSVRKATEKRKKARRKWRTANAQGKTNTQNLWNKYMKRVKDTKASYEELQRKDKTRWRKKVMQEGRTNSKTLWRALKDDKPTITALNTSKGVTTSQTEMKRIAENFFNKLGDASPTPDADDPRTNTTSDTRTTQANKQHSLVAGKITRKEIKRALRKLKPGKAIGQDRIPNSFLKHGGPKLLNALGTIFNLMRTEGWTPEEWNSEVVTLIHKKGDKKDLDNYRAIAISSNVGKLFIRILTHRLLAIAEKQGWLPEAQAAFRQGRCIEDHQFILNYLIERANKTNSPLYLGFIDLRKAFDSVDRTTLWNKLTTLGLDTGSVKLLQGLYRCHKRTIKIGRITTAPIPCHKGLRQGCPLSPLLFTLLLGEVSTKLKNTNIGTKISNTSLNSLVYADDLVLIANTEIDMAILLMKLVQSIAEIKLEINYSKSTVMSFSCPILNGRAGVWKIHNPQKATPEEITNTDTYTYLGLTVSRCRGNTTHWNNSKTTVNRQTNVIKAKANQTWDRLLSGRVMWTQAAKIRALKGAAVCNTPMDWIHSLDVAQNKFARWLTKTSPRTTATGLKRELGWNSIGEDIAMMKLAWLAKVKKMGKDRWPTAVLTDAFYLSGRFMWQREVSETLKTYNIDQATLIHPNHKIHIKSAIESHREDQWQRNINNNPRLKHQTTMTCHKLKEYLNNSKNSSSFCQARLCDFFSITGEDNPTHCALCSAPLNCPVFHILKNCPEIKAERISSNQQILERTWTCDMLADTSPQARDTIGKLIQVWTTKRKTKANQHS